MKKHLLFLFFVTVSVMSFSQNYIKGIVTDSTKTPVPFCAMALLNAKDSSLVKGNVSDDNGKFIFENIIAGSYRIKFSNVGYKVYFSSIIIVDSLSKIELAPQVLKSEGINLKEISVAVFKPTIEFKKGTVVMNVENNIMAGGNTVFDILKRIPGVSIDAQNNILVNGKGGVRFLMDGRLQQIATSQMINLLMGMPADAVSVLELITNPPAKYDASGTGGLINIVLKKVKVKGFSGSLAQSVSKGDNWRGGTFLNLNFKSNKLTFFSSLNENYLQFETKNYFQRNITDSLGTFRIISQGNQKPFRQLFFFNSGIEYELSKKTIIGVNVTGDIATVTNIENARVDVISPNYFNYNTINFRNDSRSDVINPTYNINALHKFDSVTNLSFSTDCTNYTEQLSRFNASHYYDNTNSEVAPVNRFGSTIHNDFNIYTQKLDFDKQLKKGFSIETGAKSSFVNNFANSIVQLTNSTTNEFYIDSNYSNSYRYHERILAAYVTLGKQFNKIEILAGMRAEQALINASNAPKPFTLHRNYINFFPSASIDYKLNKKNNLQANYSYRIGRPSYDQLNPSRVFNDAFSNGAGNPLLKPQYIHSMALNYNYNNLFNIRLSHDQTKDNIYYYAYGNPTTKMTIDSVFNFKNQTFTNLGFSIQKQVNWANFNFFSDFIYRTSNTLVNDELVNNVSYMYYIYGSTEFILPHNIKFQIQGNFNSSNYDGIQKYYPNGRLDLVLFKSFFNKQLDVSISLFDALYTDIHPYTNSVAGQYSYYTERTDTRRFRLWIMWKFGKMHINQNVKRSNEEEKGRLKSVN